MMGEGERLEVTRTCQPETATRREMFEMNEVLMPNVPPPYAERVQQE